MLFTGKFTKGTANKKVGWLRSNVVEEVTSQNMSVFHIDNKADMTVYIVDKLILVPGPKNKITTSGRYMFTGATVAGRRCMVVDSKFLKLSTKQQVALYYYALPQIEGWSECDLVQELGFEDKLAKNTIDLDATDALRLVYAATMAKSAKAATAAVRASDNLALKSSMKTLKMFVKEAKKNTADAPTPASSQTPAQQAKGIIDEILEEDEPEVETIPPQVTNADGTTDEAPTITVEQQPAAPAMA